MYLDIPPTQTRLVSKYTWMYLDIPSTKRGCGLSPSNICQNLPVYLPILEYLPGQSSFTILKKSNFVRLCPLLSNCVHFCQIVFTFLKLCLLLSNYVPFCPILITLIRLFPNCMFYKSEKIHFCPIVSTIAQLRLLLSNCVHFSQIMSTFVQLCPLLSFVWMWPLFLKKMHFKL